MIRCYIGLGSNLQQPGQQIQSAIAHLRALANCRFIQLSPLYGSTAVGPGTQPDYVNAVAAIDTSLTPEILLDALQAIEQQQGRQRNERWGARSLDLDILLYGDQQIQSPRLTVPHPRMWQREFVTRPLADIAPELRPSIGSNPAQTGQVWRLDDNTPD